MKYIPAEKLIAEIEKEKKNLSNQDFGERCAIIAYDVVLSFIASFQQEQPEMDLEKEINLCWINWLSPSNQKEVDGVLPKTEFEMYARHFYELGLNARKEVQP